LKYSLININFDKTTPEHAKFKMEKKINKTMFKVGLFVSLIVTILAIVYKSILKKTIKVQQQIEAREFQIENAENQFVPQVYLPGSAIVNE